MRFKLGEIIAIFFSARYGKAGKIGIKNTALYFPVVLLCLTERFVLYRFKALYERENNLVILKQLDKICSLRSGSPKINTPY
ncbi:hypothetical protein DM482_03130 [Avibacterium paragallinarum]|uniref:Uncharacterized protein n=1 Tax=Avibacterium paragallinarum TaxID=728 RepID=A0AAE5TJM3_AVIPA|nr:hypothetical protein DM482_03130 [Avibacterium paragallinarum]PXZ41603.1 hypothetical protein DM481_04500 [Avibacterium paragallinarum]